MPERRANRADPRVRKPWRRPGGHGATSLYTNWRERRRDFALKDLLRVTAPEWRESQIADEIPPGEPVTSEFGRGRVVYILRINPAIAKPPTESTISAYWKLPHNWREIVESLRWAAGGFSMEVDAPATVIAEVVEQKNTRKLPVHLLNYDVAHTPAVSNHRPETSPPRRCPAENRNLALAG
jgi:hypothetical protein